MTPALADLLGRDKNRDKLIRSSLEVGAVLKMKLTKKEGITPKNGNSRDKYFIIIGFDDSGNAIGVLLINSVINANLPDEIKLLHYPLKKDKYSFLSHNSHVDCSNIKPISNDVFFERFAGDGSYGRIEEEDLELIIGAVKSSSTIEPKALKKFGLV